jgi:sugar lactone lactonase YvrE|nr:SMP-30/gluconolactonase/LRE family protein [Neorhizobium vignae]
MTVELLDYDLPLSQLGEGAHWNNQDSTLYWVDIAGQTVHTYQLPDEVHSSWRLSTELSFVFSLTDGHLLVASVTGRTTSTLEPATKHRLLYSSSPATIA